MDGFECVDSEPVAICRNVGFVSQLNVEKVEASPNMARGKGCWGRMVPDGSDSPGRMCMGRTCAKSSRCAERLMVGCTEKVVESYPYRRYNANK